MVAPMIARDTADRRDGGLAHHPGDRSPTRSSRSSRASRARRRSPWTTPGSTATRSRRPRRRRGGEPGEVDVPRRDEPRDPDADERDHRHERAAAGDDAGRRAARLRRDDPDLRRRPAHGHQRHPRLLQDRGRQGRAGARAVRARRTRRGRARPARAGRRRRKGSSSRTRWTATCPAGSSATQGRVRQIALNLLSNALKFTDSRRGGAAPSAARAVERRRGSDRRPLGDHDRRPRHRHRHPAVPDGPAVPVVQPGRRVDQRGATAARASASRSAAASPS